MLRIFEENYFKLDFLKKAKGYLPERGVLKDVHCTISWSWRGNPKLYINPLFVICDFLTNITIYIF